MVSLIWDIYCLIKDKVTFFDITLKSISNSIQVSDWGSSIHGTLTGKDNNESFIRSQVE